MRWGADQDRELLAFYQQLIALRRAHPDCWSGARRLLRASEEGLLVVQIGNDTNGAIVALNRAATEERIGVPSESELAFASEADVREMNGAIVLPPYVGAILTRG
jgi:glycosidase